MIYLILFVSWLICVALIMAFFKGAYRLKDVEQEQFNHLFKDDSNASR